MALNNTTGHTSQPYRGFIIRAFVFRPTSPVDPNWGYEVVVIDDKGARVSGPYTALTGYHTRRAAEDASNRRGRLAIDALFRYL